MINQATRVQILNEAVQIGDHLLTRADYDHNGISWKTLAANQADIKRVIWHKTENIYNGVAGIALFFIELYRQTQDGRYLEVVYESMRWVEAYCHDNPSSNYAFFTGRMGVSYVFSQISVLTGDTCFLEKAVALARPCEIFAERPGVVNDLIGGTSGTLLGLLHLHALTGESWIVHSINVFIKHLLQNVYHGLRGLYWDRSSNMISGLCGLAHGAAGIGFVFLELGRYFQNDAFYQIAQQAFVYESSIYNPEKKNWPDMRKVIFDQESYEEYRAAYLSGDTDFFVKSGDTNAWCHGAAGIGLTRLRAYELLQQDSYKQEAQIAIEKTIQTNLTAVSPVFILCHGQGGNAELFLEAYRLLKNPQYLYSALEVAQQALAYKKKESSYLSGYYFVPDIEDTSLFMGSSGIGYFYLRLLDPIGAPSILLPKLLLQPPAQLDFKSEPYLSISYADVQDKFCRKVFPRTLALLQQLSPTTQPCFYKDAFPIETPLRRIFVQNIKNLITSLPETVRQQISPVFDLEVEKVSMDERITNNAALFIRERVKAEQTTQILESTDFPTRKIILNPDVQIRTISWSPSRSVADSEQPSESQSYTIIMKPTALGVIEAELAPLPYHILSAFTRERTVIDVLHTFFQDVFPSMAPDQAAQIKEIIIQQIKQALVVGFLIGVEREPRLLLERSRNFLPDGWLNRHYP